VAAYSIDLEEGGLLVPSTRGLLRSRTRIVANLEECGLLHQVKSHPSFMQMAGETASEKTAAIN
jgi:hypothetical protein